MVGYTLRQERERQNLTIEDIEQGTSIRVSYIEAIEAGEYDQLPGAVYTKGFIKNYAKFLGMDADDAAKEFAKDLVELSGETAEPEPVADVKPTTQIPERKSEPKPERRSANVSMQEDNRSSSMLIVAAVVLVAAIAGGLWSWLSSSDDDVATVNPPPIQQETTQPAEPPADNSTPVANANPAPPQSDKVEVQARFNGRCWALVTVDGVVVQEGVIEGGQTISWEGKDNISFRLGNAGAVEFFQGGKSLGVQGAEGDVVDRTFTRQ